jgi:hypothetical protein
MREWHAPKLISESRHYLDVPAADQLISVSVALRFIGMFRLWRAFSCHIGFLLLCRPAGQCRLAQLMDQEVGSGSNMNPPHPRHTPPEWHRSASSTEHATLYTFFTVIRRKCQHTENQGKEYAVRVSVAYNGKNFRLIQRIFRHHPPLQSIGLIDRLPSLHVFKRRNALPCHFWAGSSSFHILFGGN